MAGEVVNSNFGLLNKFGESRQEIASKTATAASGKTLCVIATDDRKVVCDTTDERADKFVN